MDTSETRPDLLIAHISDLHVGSQYFISNLLSRAIEEINELRPDIVILTGDITNEGFRQEYQAAAAYLKEIECEHRVFVPGNHDSRNVGYVHFEELVGKRDHVLRHKGVTLVSADSSEPDLENGHIGRERYEWILNAFSEPADLKIFALHHHLIPVPGTGRERNIIYDAGDLIEVLIRAGVDLVLAGHKHVSHVWKLESLIIANAGTTSSLRLRGSTKPSYNLIEKRSDGLRILRKHPFGGIELISEFARKHGDNGHGILERTDLDHSLTHSHEGY